MTLGADIVIIVIIIKHWVFQRLGLVRVPGAHARFLNTILLGTMPARATLTEVT